VAWSRCVREWELKSKNGAYDLEQCNQFVYDGKLVVIDVNVGKLVVIDVNPRRGPETSLKVSRSNGCIWRSLQSGPLKV